MWIGSLSTFCDKWFSFQAGRTGILAYLPNQQYIVDFGTLILVFNHNECFCA